MTQGDPRNVLIVSQRFRPLIGGAEAVLWQFALELVRQQHRVTVVTARYEPTWASSELWDGVHVVRLPLPAIRFYGTFRYLVALDHWLQRSGRKFDVCYVSMLKHSAYACVGARRWCRFPVVLRPEGAGETGDIAWQRRALGGRWIARRCRAADAVVALSPAIHHELEDAGYPADRIADIPNGVPIPPLPSPAERDRFRAELGATAADQLAVYVGRLSPEKGVADLVAAWPQVEAAVPQARLIVVGSGSEETRLRAQAANCRRIVWAGLTDCTYAYLRAADLFVLPSHEEGMSIALLEAMAQGLPVLATDIAGNRRVATADRHAWLVPPRQPESLAAAIVTLLGQSPRAWELGRAAREHVTQHYSITQMVRRHLELFGQLRRGESPRA
jgi:glycosyltransferase involved in cell wall biosynthesis